ncbi:protein kinase [Quadrisphaera setariae]|uniref:protein kinase n=1 Tax=Quadrisphaera setariae TaxID=2593304 RepID=UPI001650AA0C|nr:protein kinase [Quadrisphaera setariae]
MIPSAPQVPGLLVGTPVAPPVPGRPTAWWALDEDGRDVVVQRVRPAGGTGPVAGLDEASLRRRLAHPHVAALLRVVRCREGAVQVLGPAAGGSLADLLGERTALAPGEVALLVAGLGSALACLHEEGLVHGEVCAEGVLLDGGGLPLLLGWGGARAAVPEGRRRRELRQRSTGARPRPPVPTPPGDVRSLAALGLQALGPAGTPSPQDDERDALVALLRAARDAEEAAAPRAEDLARACWEAVRPVPLGAARPPAAAQGALVTQRIRRTAARVEVGGSHDRQSARRGRLRAHLSRHPLRWAGGLLALALVTGGAAALGAAPRPDARLAGDDPAAAVAALAALRLRAVVEHDPELLDAVDVAGSAPARADAALLDELAGSRVEGASTQVVSALVEHRQGSQAWVRVVTRTSAHRITTGDQVADVPDSGPVTSRLLLHLDGGRWKVAETA